MLSRFNTGKLYYWKPGGDASILCRCVFVSEKSVGCRVLAATPDQIIRWHYGPAEVFYFVPGTMPFEEAK